MRSSLLNQFYNTCYKKTNTRYGDDNIYYPHTYFNLFAFFFNKFFWKAILITIQFIRIIRGHYSPTTTTDMNRKHSIRCVCNTYCYNTPTYNNIIVLKTTTNTNGNNPKYCQCNRYSGAYFMAFL